MSQYGNLRGVQNETWQTPIKFEPMFSHQELVAALPKQYNPLNFVRKMLGQSPEVATGNYYENRAGRDYYCGFPLIMQDSAIDCGILVGIDDPEAVYVDLAAPGNRILPTLYAQSLQAAQEIIPPHTGADVSTDQIVAVMNAIGNVMADYIPQDTPLDELREFFEYKSWSNFRPVNLDDIFREKKVVCRHRILAMGAILESMRSAEIVPRGSISFERNYGGHYSAGELVMGGHAWLRYQPSVPGIEDVLIGDATQGYYGTLREAVIFRNLEAKPTLWDYRRDREPTLRRALQRR